MLRNHSRLQYTFHDCPAFHFLERGVPIAQGNHPVENLVEIDLAGGRKLTIRTIGNGADRPYIQSVTWNGQPWSKSWISHAELVAGGTLEFHMSDTPNKQFGAAPADRPPSFGAPAGAAIVIDAS